MPKLYEFGHLEAEGKSAASNFAPIDLPAFSIRMAEKANAAPTGDFDHRIHDVVDRASKAVAQSRLLIEESKLIVQSIREERKARSVLSLSREQGRNSDHFFPRN